MTCELLECCRFLKDNMRDFPKTAEYIQERVCLGDYLSCNRYRIYKELPADEMPSCLDPDVEAVQKMTQCMQSKMVRRHMR